MSCLRCLAVAALVAGCLPLPYATPPARVSVGGGGASERGGLFVLRAGVAPQQVIESTLGRAWDVEAGYAFEAAEGDRRHGGFLTGRWWPTRGLDAPQALRFGVEGGGSLFDAGAGAHAGLAFELARFVSGPHTSLDDEPDTMEEAETEFIGAHHGELAVGVGLDAAWRRLDGRDEWLALALLTIRLPATFGLALVPLWGADE